MARTTATKVKEILSTVLSDAIVDAYIISANEVVTEVLGTDTTITDTLKAEIERWLTAHLVAATREKQASTEAVGDVKIAYQGKTELGLNFTSYGQQVLLMDTTGKLKEALSKQNASLIAITSFA